MMRPTNNDTIKDLSTHIRIFSQVEACTAKLQQGGQGNCKNMESIARVASNLHFNQRVNNTAT